MVSPELLRRYGFLGFMDDAQLKEVSMISEELAVDSGEKLLEEGEPAEALFFLVDGSVEHHYAVYDEVPGGRDSLFVGEVNPGEIFGISSLIDPFKLTTSAITATASQDRCFPLMPSPPAGVAGPGPRRARR